MQRSAYTGWGRGGRKRGLQPRQSGYWAFWYEVPLAKEDVPEAHVHLGSHLEPYQEAKAGRAWFSSRHEEPKRLVGWLDKVRGAELGNALPDEDF